MLPATRRPWHLRLGVRLFAPFLFFTGLFIAAEIVLTMLISNQQEELIVNRRSQDVIDGITTQIAERQRSKEIFAQLVADESPLPAILAARDQVGAAQLLTPLQIRLGLGSIRLYNLDGKPLITLGNADDFEPTLLDSALAGIVKSSMRVDIHGLCISAIAPIKGDAGIIGAVEVGTALSAESLTNTGDLQAVQIALYNNEQLVSLTQPNLLELLSGVSPRTQSMASLNARLNKRGYQAVAQALNNDDTLLILVPIEDVRELSAQRGLINIFIGICLTGLFLITIFLLWQDIDEPIRNAVNAAQKMIRGNYRLRVPASSIDELNQLGQTINYLAQQVETQVDALNTENAERRKAEKLEHEQRLLAEALRNATAVLNSTLDSDIVLDRLLAQIDQLIPHEVSSIMLIENETARIVKSRSTLNPERARSLAGKTFLLEKVPHLRQMQMSGQPCIIANTHEYADWVQIPELEWIRSYMGIPIRVRERIIGFINLDSTIPHFFNNSHIETLRTFAQQTGIALENAHLFDEQQKMAADTKRLYELSTSILTTSSRDEIAHAVANTIRQAFTSDAASVLIYDLQMQTAFRYSIGLASEAYVEAKRRPDGITARAFETGAPVILTGDQVHPRIRAEGFQMVVAVPLKVEAGQLGMLYANYRTPRKVDEHEIELLSMFANQAALAIANAQLRDSLREQAIRDPITGLFNRRYMEETLRREVHRALRHQSTVGVIMIDIDHFKDWNDTYGHAAGDQILHEIGKVLQANIRTEDAACRYGGEELFIILPDATIQDTFRRAEHLRQQIKAVRIETQGNLLDAVTVSVGVATCPQHGSTANTLVEAADRALYRAKNEGRDRVVAA